MLNSTYGAGYRAGMCEPKLNVLLDGTKVIAEPICPFPGRKFIKRHLWNIGYHDGRTKRLSAPKAVLRRLHERVNDMNRAYRNQLDEEVERMFDWKNVLLVGAGNDNAK